MTADLTRINGYAVAGGNGISHIQGQALATQQRGATSAIAYMAVADPASVGHVISTLPIHYPDATSPKVQGYVVIYPQLPPYGDLHLQYDFLDIRFPTCISYGSSGGPGFKTSVFAVDSGLTHTQPEWDRLRARYEVQFETAPMADVDKVEDFFYGMRGQGIGFRFKDWSDYQITNQIMGVGDGTTVDFPVFKRYRSGAYYYDRPIKKPVYRTARAYLDDAEIVEKRDFHVNHTEGYIRFETPPPAGSIIFMEYLEFDVPVRFATDELTVEATGHDQYAISNLLFIEVLT